jgi:hypothetical protein
MVGLNIHKLIHDTLRREQSARVKGALSILRVGIEVWSWVVLILAHLEVGSENACDSIIQTIQGERAVKN